MNAKYIFNVEVSGYYGHIDEAAKEAVSAGYKFLLFNNKIYYVGEGGIFFETGLIRTDIFCYL